MENILFPTDFSDVSMNAFLYALEYAQKTEAKIIVFHAFQEEAEASKQEQKIYEKIDIQNFRNKKETFPPFEKLISKKGYNDVKVKYVVREGAFLETFKQYVFKREDKIDLVVMGTQVSKNHLFELFTESNTVTILDEINKPVIVVPSEAVFDGRLDNIMFLVDYNDDEKEPLEDLIKQSKQFNSKLHVVHFDLAHGASIVPLMDRFKNSLENQNFKNVTYKTIDSINLKQSLLEYCNDNKIDIVYLINHRRNFYQRMFTYSLAEDLIKNINTPIMAIYRD
ncbi:putative universal stress protein UspA [unidentified eubacterium SCB49]|nr:putative universal stress protein UspA [unidentified eubacterium SCB49]